MKADSLKKELAETASAFLTAFDSLDWEQFVSFIANDATFFMPWPTFPNRLDGIEQIKAAFRPFFTEIPQQREGPPYLNLRPLDMGIQLFGQAGMVTFHLSESDHFSRRTILFEKRDGKWQLIHLHASNIYDA